jgi:hypothetical protein
MDFQGSRYKWQGTVYQQLLATIVQVPGWKELSIQKRETGRFVVNTKNADRLSEVVGWTRRLETYRRKDFKEYSAPSLKQAKDYTSRQLLELEARHFCLPFSTVSKEMKSLTMKRGLSKCLCQII